MHFFEVLKQWDTSLFLLINSHYSAFFDQFMYAVSFKFTWIPLYIITLFVIIKQWKKEAIWVVLSLILCIVISDQIASGVLKGTVKRLRPSHVEDLKNMIHLVKGDKSSLYGFASSHASNAMGFAFLTAVLYKRRLYTIFIIIWAIITAYSRIYMGVHFPLDVIGGFIIGASAACFCYWLLTKIRPLSDINNQKISLKYVNSILIVLGLSFSFIIFYSLI